ncbi:hypothetical protein [Mycobacterium intracellulare]|uniref:hypothetical protein n=1 Tax=Mycobacterium intracellulare TaxID=1767 RepID=UPI00109E9F74|nr:hypothetical protein [Mycobacterium intracellulare]
MSDTKPNSPEHKRTWASLGGFVDPDGPPNVAITEDKDGALVRMNPFGRVGPDMCMTIDRWRQLSNAVEAALAGHTALRLRAL